MEHQSIEELDLEIKKLIAKKKKLQKIAFSSPLEQFREVLIKYKYEPFFEIKEENNQYFLVGKGFEYSYKFNKDWGIKRIKNKIKSLIDPDGELSSETVFQIKNVIKMALFNYIFPDIAYKNLFITKEAGFYNISFDYKIFYRITAKVRVFDDKISSAYINNLSLSFSKNFEDSFLLPKFKEFKAIKLENLGQNMKVHHKGNVNQIIKVQGSQTVLDNFIMEYKEILSTLIKDIDKKVCF